MTDFHFSMEEKNIQVSLESKLKRMKQLTASRSNRLRRFGDRMPELLESIDKAYTQGRFIRKPVGPIGKCSNYNEFSQQIYISCIFMNLFITISLTTVSRLALLELYQISIVLLKRLKV